MTYRYGVGVPIYRDAPERAKRSIYWNNIEQFYKDLEEKISYQNAILIDNSSFSPPSFFFDDILPLNLVRVGTIIKIRSLRREGNLANLEEYLNRYSFYLEQYSDILARYQNKFYITSRIFEEMYKISHYFEMVCNTNEHIHRNSRKAVLQWKRDVQKKFKNFRSAFQNNDRIIEGTCLSSHGALDDIIIDGSDVDKELVAASLYLANRFKQVAILSYDHHITDGVRHINLSHKIDSWIDVIGIDTRNKRLQLY